MVYGTSKGPQKYIGNYLGPCSNQEEPQAPILQARGLVPCSTSQFTGITCSELLAVVQQLVQSYLEGQGNVVSIVITPVSHVKTTVICVSSIIDLLSTLNPKP